MSGPEAKIEKAVCSYAEKHGILQRKYTNRGRRDAPDRIFFTEPGRCFFIEFKAPGEKPRPGQVREADKLRAKGFKVYTVDNTEKGKVIIDAYS